MSFLKMNKGIEVEYIVNSIFKSMTYILMDDNVDGCWLIDCGDVDKVVDRIGNRHIEGVLLTHAHFDHIYGLNHLMEMSPDTLVYTNSIGLDTLMDPRWNFSHYHDSVEDFVFSKPQNVRYFEDVNKLSLAPGLEFSVLSVPGHDPSCLAFVLGKCVFTGDAYIPGLKTVTTFPRSNKIQAAESLTLIKGMEADGYDILPGHWRDNLLNINR